MPGLNMQMGLGGAGSYSGPIFGADGTAADVPSPGGYPDTFAPAMLSFGPTGAHRTGGGGSAHLHCLSFGVVCFGLLIFMAWALPR